MTKEDMERLATRVMSETIRSLHESGLLDKQDAIAYAQTHIPVALTPDVVTDEMQRRFFANEKLNQNCLIRIVRVK